MRGCILMLVCEGLNKCERRRVDSIIVGVLFCLIVALQQEVGSGRLKGSLLRVQIHSNIHRYTSPDLLNSSLRVQSYITPEHAVPTRLAYSCEYEHPLKVTK